MKTFTTHLLFFLLACCYAEAQTPVIYSGVPLFDDQGNTVSAHASCMVKHNGRFYLFGEKHSDTSNAFAGFSCYSSTDLSNWTFENIVLPVQPQGKLGPNRVGERVKVMKCSSTGEFIMYMHVDTLGYRDPFIGYATSSTINGIYTFRGPLLYKGQPIKKWDMGSFQDTDSAGYILVHGGDIYKLSNDYKTAETQVLTTMSPDCESPALFHKDSLYYWLSSHRTSWERNDNFYYTATSLQGPWTYRGGFAPAGTLTWNAQTSFVFPLTGTKETSYLFMGDRWAFPRQASAATYVWQPLKVAGTSLSIPHFSEALQVNIKTAEIRPFALPEQYIFNTDEKKIKYRGNWVRGSGNRADMRSDAKADAITVDFTGRQIALYSISDSDGGYAAITIRNRKGKIMVSSIVDMYCKYKMSSLKFISPVLAPGNYTFQLTVMGERGNWSDKRRADYGSTGNFVSLEKISITH